MEKTIMDVSRHQGVIDWAKVKASGKVGRRHDPRHGQQRGGQGQQAVPRPLFRPQLRRVHPRRAAGGRVWLLQGGQPGQQADKELAYVQASCSPAGAFELPVAVDIEDEVQKPLGKAALTDLTAYMLSTVESWGVYAMLYTGLWFGSTFLYMGGAELKPYDVWLAAYRTRKPAPGWPFGMWQYTSTARVPGVSTNVDMSHAYKDYASIIKRAGLGAVKGV